MPRDNNGNFSVQQTVLPNTTARAADVMANVLDLGAEVTDSLSRSGKGSMQAPLEMGGNRITDVGAGVDPTDAATVAQTLLAIPAGAVMHFARATAPDGWLKANGAAVSRTTYAALFTAIGTTFGVGDGSTTFNLPELRGEFVRGLDDGRAIDAARTLGSAQSDLVKSHTHPITDPGHIHPVNDPGHSHPYSQASGLANTGGPGQSGSPLGVTSIPVETGSRTTGIYLSNTATGITVNASGGAETRPRNVALLACIKT